jgi:acetate kinase
MKILVLNGGSSSFKGCLYDITNEPSLKPGQPLWQAKIDCTDNHTADLSVKTASGGQLNHTLEGVQKEHGFELLLDTLWTGAAKVIDSPAGVDIVGHRIVHGGDKYTETSRVTAALKAEVSRLEEFAPLHNHIGLQGIEAVEKLIGDVPQVAVFDTAFHRKMPLKASLYAVPYKWYEEQGIHRYGFHGINHQYCAQRCAEMFGKDLASLRIIVCHLGNGCSLTAVKGGISIDTTMGFTPLEGLVMGTRSGSIDPGILLYLLKHEKYTSQELDKVLNHASGLLGVSDVSGDMRQIMEAIGQGNERASLAFDIFIHSLRHHIGAMLASLEGLDAIVFTGGIGESSAAVRSAACQAFKFLGVEIDDAKNASPILDADVSSGSSGKRVLVIAAQENWAIARQCWQMQAAKSGA